jgi:microcystin-dependent protein
MKNALFDISGQTTVVLQANQLPPHAHHTYRGLSTNVDPGGGAFPSAPVSLTLSDINSTIPMKDPSGNTISDPPDPIPIMNPYISLIYIIKY